MSLASVVLVFGFPVLVLYMFINRTLYSEATKSLNDRLVLHTLARSNRNEGDGAEKTSGLKPLTDTQENATDTRRPSSDHTPHDEQSITQIDKIFNDSQSDIVRPNDKGNISFTQLVFLSENNRKEQLYDEMNESLKKTPFDNKAPDIITQKNEDTNGSWTENSVSTLEDKENISNDSEPNINNFNTGIINQTEEEQNTTQGNETANVDLVNGPNYNQPAKEENSSSPRLPDNPIQPSESANRDNKQSETVALAEQKVDNPPSQPPVKENNSPDYNMTKLNNDNTKNNETFPMRWQKSQETEDNNSSPELPMLLAVFSKSAEPNTVEVKQGVNERNVAISNHTIPDINVNQTKIFSRNERELNQEEPKVSKNKTSATDLFHLYNLIFTSATEGSQNVNAIESEHVSDIKPIKPGANDNENDVSQSDEEGLTVKSEVPPQEGNTSIPVTITETVTGTDELNNPTKYKLSNDDNDRFIVFPNNNDADKHEKSPQESNSSSSVNLDVNVTTTEPATENNDPLQRTDNDSANVVNVNQPNNISTVKNELPPQESNTSNPVNQDVSVTTTEPATDNNDPSQRTYNDGTYVANANQPNNISTVKNELPPQESNSSEAVYQDVNVTTTEPAIENNDPLQRTDNDSANVVNVNQPNNISTVKNELPLQESNSSNPVNQDVNVTTIEPGTDNNDQSQQADNDRAYVVNVNQPNNISAEKNVLPPQESNSLNPVNQDVNVTTTEPATDNNDPSQWTDNDSANVVNVNQPNNTSTVKNELPPQESNSSNPVNQDNNDPSQRADNDSAYVVNLSQPDNISAENSELSPQEINRLNPVNQDVNGTGNEPATANNEPSQWTDNDSAYVVNVSHPNDISAMKNVLPPQERNSSNLGNQDVNVTTTEPATDNNDPSQQADNDGAYVVRVIQPNNIHAEKNKLSLQEEPSIVNAGNNLYPRLPDVSKILHRHETR